MPDEHARLSPSAAKRWISCPASVRLAAAVPPEPDSPYAAEGTAAHALGERKAATELLDAPEAGGLPAGLEDAARDAGWDLDEMHEHTDTYVELLRERLSAVPHSVLMLERRVTTGLPMCWGTSDAVIVSPEHVEIVDLKYGAGVPVSAYENPQLMLYGVGALDTFGDVLGTTQRVVMTVFQPRAGDGEPSSFVMDADELRAWRDSLVPVAQEALAGSDRFGPSEDACRWCPVKGTCRARHDWSIRQDFTAQPDLLTPEELGEILHDLPGIRAWVRDVEAAALAQAHDTGTEIPGWKVVLSGGVRKVLDVDAALERFEAAGLAREVVTKPPVVELLGLGDLERQLKALPKIKPEGATRARAPKLEDVLGDLVTKTDGKPSLVPADDPRPAHDRDAAAAREFAE